MAKKQNTAAIAADQAHHGLGKSEVVVTPPAPAVVDAVPAAPAVPTIHRAAYALVINDRMVPNGDMMRYEGRWHTVFINTETGAHMGPFPVTDSRDIHLAGYIAKDRLQTAVRRVYQEVVEAIKDGEAPTPESFSIYSQGTGFSSVLCWLD